MIIKLNYRTTTTIVNVDADVEFAKNTMETAQCIIYKYRYALISAETDIDYLISDMRAIVPDLTIADAMSIKSAMETADSIPDMIIEICNILAKGDIFKKENYLEFRVTHYI